MDRALPFQAGDVTTSGPTGLRFNRVLGAYRCKDRLMEVAIRKFGEAPRAPSADLQETLGGMLARAIAPQVAGLFEIHERVEQGVQATAGASETSNEPG